MLLNEKEDLSIIIIDSGGVLLSQKFPLKREGVQIITTEHKNQPYQRYLGYLASKSEWLLFLDDDMEPLPATMDYLEHKIEKDGRRFSFFALNFIDKHPDSFLNRSEPSILRSTSSSKLETFLRKISGYPLLPPGKYWSNGVKGPQPSKGGETEYSSGGAFLVRKDVLYKNFNMQLFDLYEKREGKGEDGILSYTASMITKVFFISKTLFLHNDQNNSVYTKNDFQFNRTVAFSRAYLNYEFHRLNNLSLTKAKLKYLNYSFWRLLGLIVNFICNREKRSFSALKGYFLGVYHGHFFKYDQTLSRNSYWKKEALRELGNA